MKQIRAKFRRRRNPRILFGFLAVVMGFMVAVTALRAWAAYDYTIPITVTDTGGVARTNLVVLAGTGINHTNLVAGGYIASDALDTNLAEGTTARSYTPRDTNLMLFLPTLGAYESRRLNYQLTYDPAQTSFAFMSGAGGSVSTSDHADLEPGGSDFVLTWVGYFEDDNTGDIACKTNAYCLDESPAGTVRARYWGRATDTLLPDGAVSSNWDIVNGGDVNSPDGSSYIQCPVTQACSAYYNLTAPTITAIPAGGITSVQVATRFRAGGTPPGAIIPGLRLSGVDVAGGISSDSSGNWVTTGSETIARPGGGAWTVADLGNLELRITDGSTSDVTDVDYIYITVNYDPGPWTATDALATGVRTVIMSKSGTTLTLNVGDGSPATASGQSHVVDNGNPLLSLDGDVAKYTTSLILDINGGADELWYQPVTVIAGTTLPDRAGAAQNGAITWGSQPGTLTPTIGALQLQNEPDYVAAASTPQAIIGSGPLGGAGLYAATPNAGVANLPFVTAIEAATADVADAEVIWLLILAVVSLLGGIGLWKLTAVGGQGNSLITLAFPAIVFGGAAMSHLGNIGWWVFVLYVMAAIGFILLDPRSATES